MNRLGSLIVCAALCAALAACGSGPAAEGENSAGPFPPTVQTKPVAANAHIMDVYRDALADLLQTRTLPDGTTLGYEPMLDMSDNQFAIFDVDGDGAEELVVLYTTTCMADMAGYVLAYDEETGSLREALSEFPLLTFYENGSVMAGWSHNQGLAGDFWPYNLYRYMPETDSYESVGSVDAWDRNFSESGFPSEVDTSGTGFVYYIMTDGQYGNQHPVDVSEYEAWLDSYIGEATELQLPFLDLTKENIAQIQTA